jgi:hypothetical protein
MAGKAFFASHVIRSWKLRVVTPALREAYHERLAPRTAPRRNCEANYFLAKLGRNWAFLFGRQRETKRNVKPLDQPSHLRLFDDQFLIRDQILIRERGQNSCHLISSLAIQLCERQARLRRHKAQQAQRIFQRSRALLRELCSQACDPVMQIPGTLQPSLSTT